MIKRLLNALGLATYKQFTDLERDWFDNARMDRKAIENILAFHANQKTFLEHKWKELEQSIQDAADCPDSDGNAQEIDRLITRVDALEEEGDGVLTKNDFEIDDYFDLDNYQGEIDTMINAEIDYSHSFVDHGDIETMIEDAILEFAKNRMTVEESIEKIATLSIEKIGGAILGLTHEEPEPAKPATEYVDPVIQVIIDED